MAKDSKRHHREDPGATLALSEITSAMRAGNFQHAINRMRGLLDTAPDDARLHDFLSTALALSSNRDQAVEHARIALVLNPNDLGLIRRTVSVLQRAGLYQEALTHTERGLYKSPKDTMLNRIRVTLLTNLGKHRLAGRALEKHSKDVDLEQPNEALSIHLLAARLAPEYFKPAEMIEKLEPLLAEGAHAGNLPGPMLKAAHFEHARLLEHESEHDRAFAHYVRSNELNDQPWDPEAHSGRVARLADTAESLARVPSATYTHPTLAGKNIVFILGMMRSGSTLLEQIITQIPGVVPTDEQPTLLQTIASIERELNPDEAPTAFPMPLSADRYTLEHINTLARNALNRYADLTDQETERDTGIRYITDKQTEHYHILPLLPKILPGCTIIYTARDPLDTCFSNFTQSFAQGHPHTDRLEWIAQFHNDHDRLMEAWRSMQDITIHEVRYAHLVTDPERETKRLADLLVLEWTPKVLDFHRSTRTAATASQNQVRKPLYTTSIGRAQRFSKHLDPLREALGKR